MVTKRSIAAVLLYTIALIPRSFQLEQTGVYPDEITWMVKGKEYLYALKNRDLTYLKNAWWNNPKDSYAIGLPLAVTNGASHILFAGTGKFSLRIFSDIIASRLPVVLIGSLLTPLMFIYFSKYISPKASFIASITYALNPIAIGLDRWVIHDSYLTLFSFLALISFNSSSTAKTIFPGFWLSLAFLTKPNGILPIFSWATHTLFQPAGSKLSELLKNIVGFFTFTTVLWPSSWFLPIISVPLYIYNQTVLTRYGDPVPNYFLGQSTFYPNPTYYLFQFFFRTPEVIILFVFIGGLLLVKRLSKAESHKKSLAITGLTYIILFFVTISLTPQKGGIRYALPLLPWIYILSGWGIFQFVEKYTKRRFLKILAYFTFIFFSSYPISYHPNYYLYYNYLIGGPGKAQKYDLVGLCFGSKKALNFIDRNNLKGVVSVVGCSDTATYHTSRNLTKDWNKADIVILESSYIQQFPKADSVVMTKKREILFTVKENGVTTATVYR